MLIKSPQHSFIFDITLTFPLSRHAKHVPNSQQIFPDICLIYLHYPILQMKKGPSKNGQINVSNIKI